MRCFLALTPPAELALAIDQWQRCYWRVTGRKVAVQNLHVTLVFLGDLSPSLVDELCGLLNRDLFAGNGSALPPLNLCRAQYWSKSRCTVLCPHRSYDESPELMRLQTRLRSLVNQLGIAVDKRALRTHITLARSVQNPVGAPLMAPDFTWQPESIELYRSYLKPEGSMYEEMASWRIQSI